MTDTLRTLIIPAALTPAARNLCDCLSPRGSGMFETALSPSGSGPASHYISSGYVSAQFAALATDASRFHGAAQQGAAQQSKTLTATLAETEAVIAGSDITDDPPFEAMARLGLQLLHSEDVP